MLAYLPACRLNACTDCLPKCVGAPPLTPATVASAPLQVLDAALTLLLALSGSDPAALLACCQLGFIPAVLRFASPSTPLDLRMRASRAVAGLCGHALHVLLLLLPPGPPLLLLQCSLLTHPCSLVLSCPSHPCPVRRRPPRLPRSCAAAAPPARSKWSPARGYPSSGGGGVPAQMG